MAPTTTRMIQACGAVAVLAAATLASCTPSPEAASSPPPAVATSQAAPTPTSAAPTAEPIDVTQRAAVALTAPDGVDMGAAAGRSLVVPLGWEAEVWAAVPDARIAAWSPDGRLLVSSPNLGAVLLITPQGPDAAPAVTTLASGLTAPQGLAFASQEGADVLVVGEANAITAWDYADGAVSNRRVLAGNLPTSGHGAKGVAVDGDVVYYSLGSSGNRSPADRDASPERAVVASMGLDGTGGAVIARGVRNGFGLDIAPDGTLFTAVNQSDNQSYPYRDDTGQYGQVIQSFVNENPLEQVTRVTLGDDLGWPFCFPDAASSESSLDLAYVADPETNPDGARLDCSTLGTTGLGIGAHSAPLDLVFTAGTSLEPVLGSGALIGVHGSWNRQPPREPAVLWSPWDDASASLGEALPLVTGFQNEDGSRWGRAVSAVPGPDGALYVTDDAAGLVYRLTPATP